MLYIGGDFSSPNNTYRSIVSYDYQGGQLKPLNDIGVNGTVAAVTVSGSCKCRKKKKNDARPELHV